MLQDIEVLIQSTGYMYIIIQYTRQARSIILGGKLEWGKGGGAERRGGGGAAILKVLRVKFIENNKVEPLCFSVIIKK